MKGSLYPALQGQYSYLSEQYPSAQSFEDWLAQSQAQQGAMQSNLAGAQTSLGGLAGLTQQLMRPESYSAAMQPYLNQAYQGIGYSGMPGGTYADKTLAEAVQQGYMQNLGNILQATGAEQAQRGQIGDIVSSLNQLAGQEYAAKTEPLDFIKAIQQMRYGQGVSASTGSQGQGSSTGLLGWIFG